MLTKNEQKSIHVVYTFVQKRLTGNDISCDLYKKKNTNTNSLGTIVNLLNQGKTITF